MAKKGERYECGDCGLIVAIEDPCGCSPCSLICCEAPMKEVKKKAKKKDYIKHS